MKLPLRSSAALTTLAALASTGISCRQTVPPVSPVAQVALPTPPQTPVIQATPVVAKQTPANPATDPDNPDVLPAFCQGKIVREHPPHFDQKLIALTFDDGPDPRVTPKVLKALGEYNAHATFFVVGKEIPGHEKLLKRMVAEGHIIGNHTYSHPSNPPAARARMEIDRTDTLITQAIGHAPTCFRPPYGIRTSTLVTQARHRGYGIFLWTIDPGDTRGNGTQSLIRGVLRSPEMGDIVILHDGNNHQASAAAVTPILEALSAKGWKFVTIPEMMAAWDEFRKTHPKSAQVATTAKRHKKRVKKRAVKKSATHKPSTQPSSKLP